MRGVVDEVAEGVMVEVKENADHVSSAHSPISTVRVLVSIKKPATFVVHVHTPGFFVFACWANVVSVRTKVKPFVNLIIESDLIIKQLYLHNTNINDKFMTEMNRQKN